VIDVGLGLGWLIFGASRGPRTGAAERTMRRYRMNAGTHLGHRVQEGASHLVEGAQGVAHDATDTVGSARRGPPDHARRARHREHAA
jgi:hypothetical protein